MRHTVTVDSRYLEFCKTRSVYLNQKYILIAFSIHNLAFETFLQVQITQSANEFELVKKLTPQLLDIES